MAKQNGLIGKEILTYRIESLIGKGGMGSVYLAENKHINQKVAIKALNANLAENSIVRQKFINEAKTLLALDHPNIVHFLNFVENEDGVFLIMEYVNGITLDDFINTKQGVVVEERAYFIFSRILDAFTCAHKKGIVHRDIKPANIILTSDSEGNFVVKVLDFGIAKIISESNRDEKSLIFGTPVYMSPEQVRGEDVDERSDIYSLGVLLHQMLSGRAPYDTTTLSKTEIKRRVVEDTLPRIKEFYGAHKHQDKLQGIVDKATAKDPEKRFRSCTDFRRTLKNIFEPEKFPRAVKYAALAFVALLAVCGWWLWDYNCNTKIHYYRDYAEQWGVPAGIGKADYRHREKTYRFEYRKGKLRHIALINSNGNIVTDGESERFDRPVNADFEYQDKNIAYILYKNKNGKPLFRKRYNKKDGKINMFVFEYNDENGTDKRLPKDLTGYVRLENETAERGQISRFALEFDKNGYVTGLHYRNLSGEPACDKEHIYGKRYERDSRGRVIKEYLLAHNDSLTATSWGLAIKEFTYENDNMVKVLYLSPDNLPALDDKDGIERYEMEYDPYGNLTYAWYKSADGSLMLPQKQECSGVKYIYNKQGQVIEVYNLGLDREVAYSKGCFGIKWEYDDNGYIARQTYMDAEGQPCAYLDDSVVQTVKNDIKGNPLEISYLDAENQPLEIAATEESLGGYAKSVSEYDTLGNRTSVFFYGADDALCLNTDGYAGQRYKFNDKNNLLELTCYGLDMEPCEVNGIITVKYEYNSRGEETKRVFYAADGISLVLNHEGIAGWETKYDDNGNETESTLIDTKSSPTEGNLGYARYTRAYNANGYLEEVKYFDKTGNPVFVKSRGHAAIKYKYDARGNIVECAQFGVKGQLAVTRYKYNERDNQTEIAYYDRNDMPDNSGGYSKMVNTYNERNQIVEWRYYNSAGKLALVTDNVGKYALLKNEYDLMGRIVRQTYFDENEQPTPVSLHVPEGLVKYDNWGNMNYRATADGYGKLINNPQTGYAIVRWIYDIRRNKLEEAVFDRDSKVCSGKNNTHKIAYTYDRWNRNTEIRYYSSPTGLRRENFAITRMKYDGQNNMTEYACYNYLDKAIDCIDGIAHKATVTYSGQGNPLYKKWYRANGVLLLTQKWNGKNWVAVNRSGDSSGTESSPASKSSSGWRERFREMAETCPYMLNSEAAEILSVVLSSNSCTLTKRYIDISRYNISSSALEQKKSKEAAWMQNIKQENKMPDNASLILICVDKAKRELFRITY